MNELSIRVTHRTEIDGRSVEKTIDIETIPPARIEQIAAPLSAVLESTRSGGRIKIAADGTQLPAGSTRTDHVAVLDQATGLMWSVESMGNPDDEDDGITQELCIERCKQLRLLGFGDWHLSTRAELVSLIDDTRSNPALDVDLFPRVKPRWHWTSTAVAGSSASAWYVVFNGGLVYGSPRNGDGFALAVRRAGQ